MTSNQFRPFILLITLIAGGAMAQGKPSITVTSNNQQGGITAYQVNIGRIDLTFNDETALEITKLIPKDRPFDLRGVGSARDQQVVNQYAGYLQSAGYTLRNHSVIGVMGPPPDLPITITVFPDHTDLLISPRS